MRLTKAEWEQQAGVDGSVDVDFHDNVAVVTMKCGENRCNVDFVKKMNTALDQVEQNTEIEFMVTTGSGRFYGNGLDLAWLGMIGTSTDGPKRLLEFRNDYLQPLYERLITFPLPTIAAVNGHCYAAGLVLALCHDYRIMNSERGWLCLNEVHNGLRFNDMMYQIFRSCLPSGQTFHEACVLGRRYSGAESVEAGICAQAVQLDQLIPEAKKIVARLGSYSRESLQTMKRDMYASVIEACRQKDPGRDAAMMSNL